MSRQKIMMIIAGFIVIIMIVHFRTIPWINNYYLNDFAAAGNLEGVRESLLSGADPNERQSHGSPPVVFGVTPLMLAARAESLASVKILVEAGADINAVNEVGETPLHYGIESKAIIEYLLENGADPSIRTSYGDVPLTKATRVANVNVALLLIASEGYTFDCRSVLLAVSQRKRFPILRAILERTSDQEREWESCLEAALIRAVESECFECVQELLDHGRGLDGRNEEGLPVQKP